MSGDGWLVVGGGPVALALAAAAARKVDVVLFAPPFQSRARHYALNERSLRFLNSLGATPEVCEARTFALHLDGAKPVVRLTALEAGMQRLCAVAGEGELMRALQDSLPPKVKVVAESEWQTCQQTGDGVVLTSKSGKRYAGKFVAVADGARSSFAKLLSVGVSRLDFGQTALTATVRADIGDDCAAQWFGERDTLALLPLGGGVFSLIWSLPRARAEGIGANAKQIAELASARAGVAVSFVKGKDAAAFPLFAMRRAVRAFANGVFVGDSARVIHPLAGQGLNLGFADVEELAGIAGDDVGGAKLNLYLRRCERRAEVLHCLTSALCSRKTAHAALFAAKHSPFLRRRAVLFANY